MEYDNKKLLDLSTEIAKEMIECGGEVFRAEEAIRRIFDGNCSVFVLPTLIIAQSNDSISTKRIVRENEDLSKLCTLNALARKLAGEDFVDINLNKGYSPIVRYVSTFGAVFSFCIFFGGNLLDAIICGFIGLIISFAGYKRIGTPKFSSNLIDSFIAGSLALLPSMITSITNPNKIIIGTIMLLVPGLTVANAIRDMMNSDLVAGLVEIAEAIMSALSIAFGIGGAMLIYNKLW